MVAILIIRRSRVDQETVVTLTILGYCAIIVVNKDATNITWTGGRDEYITCEQRINNEVPISKLNKCMTGDSDVNII